LIQFPRLALLVIFPMLLVISQTYISDCVGLLPYIVFFLVGTIGFLIYAKKGEYYINWISIAGLLFFIFFTTELAALLSTFFTLLLILSVKRKISNKVKLLGLISYSIYLIHFPLGIKFINFFKPRIDPDYSWILFLTTLLLSVVVSWLFFLVFESYSEKLSKKIKYS
jgi:peptidoglycan/LPS O-acetylase OafA/YrhL